MNIVVCMKPVPDPRRWGKLALDPRTMLLRRAEVPAVINPLDRNAIEQAVALRAETGPSTGSGPSRGGSRDGTVSVVSMAPREAEEQLAEALAMGCDRAFLLSDAAFAGADSLATARCLAAAIRRLGPVDLVFCGSYSADGSTSQVGPQLAELLDMPDLTHVTALSLDGGTLRARAATEGGETVYECDLPALVTFDKEVNVPRLPSMTGIMKAAESGVTCWTAADLGLSKDAVGLSGSPTQMLNIFTPPVARKGEMLEGSPNQMAVALVERLKLPEAHVMSDNHAIWVVASHHDGRVDAVALELLGKAHQLAGQVNAAVEAILVGHEVEPLAAALLHSGATAIRVLDHPSLAVFSTVRHARAIADAALRHRPQTLLLGADNENAALAARVAARLGTGLSAHCVDLKLERGLLVQTVPGFGGQVMANIVCPHQRPQMATVVAGVFSPATPNGQAEIIREAIDGAPDVRTAREIERRRPEAGGAPLSAANVVVAGGFGVGSKERWTLVEELAAVLHGEVGATRPPVDEGWARPEQMIGASGVFVSPGLYIAAGISGMMHHVVGIHGAKTIVAINSDARAPIFSMADYGIVGDLGDLLPALLHNLRTGEGLAPRIAEPGDTKTPEEFKAALRKLRPNLYKRGRLVADPVDDPVTRRTVEGHSQIFEAARDPQYQELMTATSHLTGRRISRYLSVIRSVDDMVANSRMKRLMFQRTGTCTGGRCAGWAALNAMWSATWDMDQSLGTDYHERLKGWLVSAQERDITLSGALTDPKGNRRQGPSKQADPDMYLRVVKRRPDGIVVRGAKVMICGTAAAHEIFVMPGVKLRREDADYAVSFAIPKDAPGITIVEARHASDDRELEEGFDNPVTRGGITQAYIFFEDVFVPKSRVFMCGEWAHAGDAVFRFTLPYRSAIGACVAGQGDVMVGAAILIARANGLDEKVFRDKITQMIVNNETTFGVGLAASMMGTQHPSGAWLPDPVLAHANKVHVATLPYETKRLTQEIAGGIAETGCMPSYQDFVDDRYGHLIQKYLKAGSPAETRMRIARLIEWLTAGAGVPGCMHGGGSPDGAKMVVYAFSDMQAKIEMAKRVGGISDISLAKPPAK